jgi:hypothetical protein
VLPRSILRPVAAGFIISIGASMVIER